MGRNMNAVVKNPIKDAVKAHPNAAENYMVQSRGRPERDPREAARSILRRKHFGNAMRDLRLAADLTLTRAAEISQVSAARKLSQYETTCYPPGDVVVRLAPSYGVSAEELAKMVLSHSDPDLYEAITGEPGYQPSERSIDEYLNGEIDG